MSCIIDFRFRGENRALIRAGRGGGGGGGKDIHNYIRVLPDESLLN